jgi:hypothetical protein
MPLVADEIPPSEFSANMVLMFAAQDGNSSDIVNLKSLGTARVKIKNGIAYPRTYRLFLRVNLDFFLIRKKTKNASPLISTNKRPGIKISKSADKYSTEMKSCTPINNELGQLR